MATIELTVTPDYWNWGWRECLRDLVQNWLDACDKAPGLTGRCEHFPRSNRLELWSPLEMGREALLVGYSTKRDDDDARGQFGEGLKAACASGVQHGYRISIRTGAESWVPEIVDSEQFPGQRVLAFHTRKVKHQPGTLIEIQGVTLDQWEEMKGMFLFMSPPKKAYDAPWRGKLLFDDAHRGRVFSGGILIHRYADLRYGYDFRPGALTVDRDRKMANPYELESAIGRVLLAAIYDRQTSGLTTPILTLAAGETVEAKSVRSYIKYDAEVQRLARAEFEDAHGKRAVPRTTALASMNFAGAQFVDMDSNLAAAMVTALGGEDTIMDGFKQEVVARYTLDDLTDNERATYAHVTGVLRAAGYGQHVNESALVTFAAPETLGLALGTGQIQIARKNLESRGRAMGTFIHEIAHVTSGAGDGTPEHTRQIEGIWESVYALMVKA